jgi:hypothetical protein
MQDIREILDTISKAELIEMIIQHSDNGYFPLDLFLLRADYPFTGEEIVDCWNDLYDRALQCDRERDDLGADILCDGAKLCLEKIKRLTSREEQKNLCKAFADCLTNAAEQDGIGMYTDSEWMYLEVRDEIEKYMEEELQ